ncbi:Double-stranded RNA-binding protein 4 [Glycine soja]|nr:Double-stranded RNA-binding protein 4 [Glycine soja]
MASSSSEPPPPVPAPVHSHPPPHLMYKNRLQEFTSRSGIKFPVYQTISPFSKSIMNEYADKLHVQPTYDTVQEQLGGVLRVFKTSLVFNGTSYTGDPARTKKEAEQSATKAAILSIMGDSTSGTTLIEIIKSKSTFYDAIKGKGPPLLQPSAVLSTTNTGQISVTLGHRDTGVTASVLDNNNNNKNIEAKVEFPESSKMLSTCQELQMIKQESSLEANNVSLQPGSEHSIDNSSTSKKRKKNKKKSNNKKLRLETPPTHEPSSSFYCSSHEPSPSMNQLYARTAAPMNQVPPRTAAPMNQVPPCIAAPMIQVAPCTAAPMNKVPSL